MILQKRRFGSVRIALRESVRRSVPSRLYLWKSGATCHSGEGSFWLPRVYVLQIDCLITVPGIRPALASLRRFSMRARHDDCERLLCCRVALGTETFLADSALVAMVQSDALRSCATVYAKCYSSALARLYLSEPAKPSRPCRFQARPFLVQKYQNPQ